MQWYMKLESHCRFLETYWMSPYFRDETRKFFQYVPLNGDKAKVVEMLFPGSHSDVGGLYDDNPLVRLPPSSDQPTGNHPSAL